MEDDEWNDYVAEEEADYSGLRIQKLNIQEETPEEEEEIGLSLRRRGIITVSVSL